jgi:hypothetical protein
MIWCGVLIGLVGTAIAVALLSIRRRRRSEERLRRAMYNHPLAAPATALFLDLLGHKPECLFRKPDECKDSRQSSEK